MTDDIRTVDFPPHLARFQEGKFRLMKTGEASTSNFFPVPRSGGPRYKLWSAALSTGMLSARNGHDERFEWEAFIDSLDGVAVAFKMFDRWRCRPCGAGAGVSRNGTMTELFRVAGGINYSLTDTTHLIAGSGLAQIAENADRFADTIKMQGLVPSSTVFLPGDLIEICDEYGRGNLHQIRDVCMSNADGESRVALSNRLHRPVVSGDIVNLEKPCGRFVLVDNEQGENIRRVTTSSASIEMIELPYFEAVS